MENVCICLVVAAISGVRGRVRELISAEDISKEGYFSYHLNLFLPLGPHDVQSFKRLTGHIRHRVTD